MTGKEKTGIPDKRRATFLTFEKKTGILTRPKNFGNGCFGERNESSEPSLGCTRKKIQPKGVRGGRTKGCQILEGLRTSQKKGFLTRPP